MTVNHENVTLDFLYLLPAKDVMNAEPPINSHYFRPSYKKVCNLCLLLGSINSTTQSAAKGLKLTLVKLRLCNFMHQSSMSKKGVSSAKEKIKVYCGTVEPKTTNLPRIWDFPHELFGSKKSSVLHVEGQILHEGETKGRMKQALLIHSVAIPTTLLSPHPGGG